MNLPQPDSGPDSNINSPYSIRAGGLESLGIPRNKHRIAKPLINFAFICALKKGFLRHVWFLIRS
jgi:hypothetical protein